MNVRHQLPPRGSIAKAAKRELTRLVRLRSAGESGFTLIEMLVTFLIIPVLIGAATFSLIGLMQGHATIANRLTSSADAQVVSSSYFNDLQSASLVTLDPSAVLPTVCPPSLSSADEWLLGLQIPASPGQAALDVSYGLVPSSSFGNTSTLALVRWQCSIGDQGQLIYDSLATLASHVPSPSLNVHISGVSCSPTASDSGCLTNPTVAAASAWISTYGMRVITIHVVDTGIAGTGGGWSYSIGASPRNWVHLVACQPPGQGLCPNPGQIQSPGLVLGLGGGSGDTSFQGNPCNVSAWAVGLNGLTVSPQGNSNPFSSVTSIYGTGYGPTGTTVYLGPGGKPLSINSGSTADPLAGDSLSTVESLLGYNQIVYLGSSWPATFTAGTIYVIGSTTPTTIPTIDLSSSGGGSILLWSVSTPNIAAPSALDIRGSTTVNLGPYGILYAPTTTLSVAGTAKLTAESVIVQNLTCNGGGTGSNLTLTSQYPNS